MAKVKKKESPKKHSINKLIYLAIEKGYKLEFDWNVLKSIRVTVTNRKTEKSKHFDLSRREFIKREYNLLYNAIKRRTI